jgi:TP901 family phage tail tape measure protein
MASVAKLVVTLGLDAAGLVTDIDRVSRKTRAKINRFTREASAAGQRIGLVLGAGFTAATIEAIKFEEAMAEVSTLLDDTSDLDSMSDAVKRLSVEFGQAPTTQAKALYQIISAGAKGSAEQMRVLTVANKLAVGGVTDVATAADGLTSVLNAYAGSGLTAERISDVMFQTMRLGKTTIGELSASIGNVATLANDAGVKFEELGAVIATVSAAGITTSQSIDGFRGVLSALLKQSEKTVEAAGELKIQFDLTRLKAVGFRGVLQDIANSGATEDQLSRLIGRIEGLANLLAVARDEGRKFEDNLIKIEGAAGQTGIAVEKMMATAGFRAKQARSAIQVLAIEIGDNFLAAVSDASVGAVENLDKVRLMAVKVGRAFGNMAEAIVRNGSTVIGVLAGFTTIKVLLPILAAIHPLGGAAALAIGLVVGALTKMAFKSDETQRVVENLGAAIATATDEWLEYASALDVISKQNVIRQELVATIQQIDRVKEEIAKLGEGAAETFILGAGSLGVNRAELEAELKRLEEAYDKAFARLLELGESLEKKVVDFAGPIGDFIDDIFEIGETAIVSADDISELEAAAKAITKRFYENRDATWARSRALTADIKENERWKKSVEGMIAVAFPIKTLVDEFRQKVEDLDRATVDLGLSQEEYQVILNFLSNALGEAAAASQNTTDQIVTDADRMREATLEAVRQMTSAFLNMWQEIISGGDNAFDGLLKGLESMLAQFVHKISTAKIGEELQNLISENGKFDANSLAGGIATAIGVALGVELGGGGKGASIGSAIGSVIGKAAFTKFFSVALGSLAGPFGAVLGSIFGGLIGGLFDGEKTIRLQIIGADVLDQIANYGNRRSEIGTSLGGFIISNATNISEDAVAQISKAVSDFDNALAQFLTPDQIDAITAKLQKFGREYENEQVSLQEIIGDRFRIILSEFTGDVRKFVDEFDTLENRIEAFGVAVTADKVFKELPELFGDRSFNEFLTVIKAFSVEAGSLEVSFETILKLLEQIGAVHATLKEFAASDLEADYLALIEAQNRSVGAALQILNQQFAEAVDNFDGSIESLQHIGDLVVQIREGEIRYLTQLDSLQKGLNTSLDQLEADILGLTAAPRDTSAILGEAAGLITALENAESAEEIDAISRQFNTLIRSISPDEQKFRQAEILQIIAAFRDAANVRFEAFRAAAIDQADATRSLADRFTTEIGDPLDILIASNERIARAVEEMAGIERTMLGEPELVAVQTHTAGGGALDGPTTAQVIDEGLDGIAVAIRSGQSENAAAIVNAIREADFPVTVVISDDGFVSQ